MSNAEEVLAALIHEVQHVLVPARFHLRREQGAHAQHALAAVQRALDVATTSKEVLDNQRRMRRGARP